MSPITHFLASWVVFERAVRSRRDKLLVVLSGVVSDLDGLGLPVDLVNDYLMRPATTWYADYHRFLTHGITFCLLYCAFAAALAQEKWRVAVLSFLGIHLHYLCDLMGHVLTRRQKSGEYIIWGRGVAEVK